MGVLMKENYIYNLLYADDQVILAEDKDDILYMIESLITEYKKWGLKNNIEKMQYIVVEGKGEDLETLLETVKHSDEYKYLGISLKSDERDTMDIMNKIIKGKRIVRRLHLVLRNNHNSMKNKHNIFKTLVKSQVVYGSELWTLRKMMYQRLTAVEMVYWRR
ncbi:uncharacterized protein LOC142325701 [Lycorma delicatula]|uniref:uncharacterized protein LOC142325701 n=1 Tax=Lycorma delicatula TaxID=130591 RepID=UPI003F51231B